MYTEVEELRKSNLTGSPPFFRGSREHCRFQKTVNTNDPACLRLRQMSGTELAKAKEDATRIMREKQAAGSYIYSPCLLLTKTMVWFRTDVSFPPQPTQRRPLRSSQRQRSEERPLSRSDLVMTGGRIGVMMEYCGCLVELLVIGYRV